jgi:hypothetical protein
MLGMKIYPHCGQVALNCGRVIVHEKHERHAKVAKNKGKKND